MKSKNTIKDFSIITLGMFIVSAAVYFFLIPSEIVVEVSPACPWYCLSFWVFPFP